MNAVLQIQDHPDFEPARAKLADLQHRLTGVERKAQDISDSITARTAGDGRRARIDDAARALLNGEDVSELSVESLQKELGRLRNEAQVLRRAVEMQHQVAESVRRRFMDELEKARRQEHVEIVRERVDAAIAWAKGNAREYKFRESVAAAGGSMTAPFRTMLFLPSKVHGIAECVSEAVRYVEEAAEFGYIGRKEADRLIDNLKTSTR